MSGDSSGGAQLVIPGRSAYRDPPRSQRATQEQATQDNQLPIAAARKC